MAQNNKKNDYIELLRFVAAFVVCSYHIFKNFTQGFIMVEFFFILTGYFTMKHLKEKNIQNKAAYPFTYTLKKFSKLLPFTMISTAFAYYQIVLFYNLDKAAAWKLIGYLPGSMFLLQFTGAMPNNVVVAENYAVQYQMSGILWYIMALFVALPVMVMLVIWLDDKIGLWMVTFLPLLLYGIIIHSDVTLNGWHELHNVYLYSDIRALAGLFMGGAVYYLSLWWGKREYTIAGKLGITVIELATMIGVILYAWRVSGSYDIEIVLLMVISLSITTSGKSYTSLIHSGVLRFLGTLSLPIYCFHVQVNEMLCYFNIEFPENMEAVYKFLIILAVAAIIWLIVEGLTRLMKLIGKNMKKIFVAG